MKDQNSPIIKYSSLFNKQRKAAPIEIMIAFREALDLFIDNPIDPHPTLRSHLLKKQYIGYRSVDATNDWRALYKIRKTKSQTIVTFYLLGTHAQLYE